MTTNQRRATSAAQRHASYAGLAQAYAAQQEGWLALHAQAAADLAGAEAAVLRAGADDARLQAFRNDAHDALAAADAPLDDPVRAAQAFRDAIGSALTHAEAEPWQASLASLDALAEAGPVTEDDGPRVRAARLETMDAGEYVAAWQAAQAQHASDAAAASAAGDPRTAIEASRLADLAGFEAWLICRSAALGDDDLTQCQLLWTLALAAIEAAGELPEDREQAEFVIRSRIAWAVGADEASSLAAALG